MEIVNIIDWAAWEVHVAISNFVEKCIKNYCRCAIYDTLRFIQCKFILSFTFYTQLDFSFKPSDNSYWNQAEI